jgi:hypothetical protein
MVYHLYMCIRLAYDLYTRSSNSYLDNMNSKIAVATAGTSQRLTVSEKKRVNFKAKITKMGDKLIIVIPKAYHKELEKKKLLGDFIDIDASANNE